MPDKPEILIGSIFHRFNFQVKTFLGRYQSGQLGQTVNLLTDVFVGSNPALPTIFCILVIEN